MHWLITIKTNNFLNERQEGNLRLDYTDKSFISCKNNSFYAYSNISHFDIKFL